MAIEIDDLKQSNDFLNILLDSITSAVFVVDSEIRLQSFNDSFKALFCKDEARLLGVQRGGEFREKPRGAKSGKTLFL